MYVLAFASDGLTASYITLEVAQRLANWTADAPPARSIKSTSYDAIAEVTRSLEEFRKDYLSLGRTTASEKTKAFANNTTDSLSTAIMALGGQPKPLEASDTASRQAPTPRLDIIGEPGWSLQDFQSQCLNDPNTLGALVVYDVENDTGSFNYIVWSRNYTQLFGDAFLVTCDWDDAISQPGSVTSPGSVISTQTQNIDTKTKGTAGSVKDPLDKNAVVTAISHQIPNNGQTTAYTQAVDNRVTSTVTTSTTGSTTSPTLTIRWLTKSPAHGLGQEGSVPFITIAAAGTFLASQTSTLTKSNQTQISTNTPTGSVSTQQGASTQSNNSVLPFGLGFLGGSLSQLSNLSVPGTNGTTILKNAAADIATDIASRLQTVCYDTSDSDSLRYCRQFFRFKPPRICDKEVAAFVRSHKDSYIAAALPDNHSCFPVGFVPPHIPPHSKNTRLPNDP
jgi:hypothetical protein